MILADFDKIQLGRDSTRTHQDWVNLSDFAKFHLNIPVHTIILNSTEVDPVQLQQQNFVTVHRYRLSSHNSTTYQKRYRQLTDSYATLFP